MGSEEEQVREDPVEGTGEEAAAGGPLRAPGMLGGLGQLIPPTGPVAISVRGFSRAFQALDHSEYRLLWIGGLLSNIGSWVENVARAWLVYELGNSKKWLGIDAFASGVTTVILLPLGGVLADHMDRRWLLAGGNIVLGVLSLLFAVLYARHELRVEHLIAGSALMGVCMALMVPASQSLLPQLVPREDLANAVALNAMQFNLSRAIGPAIGGATYAALGVVWCFSLNAGSFLTIIVAALMIAAPAQAAAAKKGGGLIASLAGGAAYLRTRGDLMMILTMVLVASFCGAPMMVLLPAYIKDVYSGGAAGYSMMLSCFGIGAVVGAGVSAVRSGAKSSPWRAFPVLMAFGLAQAGLGVVAMLSWRSHHAPFVAALLCVMISGGCFVGGMNRLMSAIMASTPNAIRGRVASYQMLCFMTGMPVGALTGSLLAEWHGARLLVVHDHLPWDGWVLQGHGIGLVFVVYGLLMAGACAGLLRLLRKWDMKFHSEGHLDGPAEGI